MAQLQWSGWSEVPGGGLTNAALAATNAPISGGDALWLFHKGLDQRIYVNTLSIQTNSWSGWSEVPGDGITDVSLVATVIFEDLGSVYLFAKGLGDQRIYFNVGK